LVPIPINFLNCILVLAAVSVPIPNTNNRINNSIPGYRFLVLLLLKISSCSDLLL
jgi:hypothetical protein